jgi:4-hydroxy-2-oxoheptanedioate aldolase
MTDFQLGMFQNLPSPMLSRYLAQMGWQWIILDLQHTSFDFSTLYECIHVVRAAGSLPFVRVGVNAYSDINRALDLGAAGVVVPMTNCRADAERAAAAAKYPPQGERSIGGDSWYHYGSEYPRTANRDTRLFIQMEHIKAAECIEDMLAVDGVDGCYVGPTDLALSLGLPHDNFETDPKHKAAIQRTLTACLRSGKIAATNTYSFDDATDKAAQGYKWITMRSDTDLFVSAAKRQLADLQKTIKLAVADRNGSVRV